MKTKWLIAAIALTAASAVAQRAKTIYKVSKLSETQVGVSCTNGADPTVRRIGDILVVACKYSADSNDLAVKNLMVSR
jgi:hypothetical protein